MAKASIINTPRFATQKALLDLECDLDMLQHRLACIADVVELLRQSDSSRTRGIASAIAQLIETANKSAEKCSEGVTCMVRAA